MKSTILLLSILLLPSYLHPQVGSFVAKGHLIGSDGKPMSFSNVQYISNSPDLPRSILKTVRVAQDGTFELPFPAPGLYRLRFTGIDHRPQTVRVLLEKPEPVFLTVRLKGHELFESLSHIRMITDFNSFSREKSLAMTVQPDGTFMATMRTKADTIAYQITGVEERTAINGTQSDYSVVSSEGDYYSVIRVTSDSVSIIFDPAKLRNNKSNASVSFADERALPSRYYAFEQAVYSMEEPISAAFDAHMASGKKSSDFDYNYASVRSQALALRESEPDPTLKNAWLLAAACEFRGAKQDSSFATLVLNSISPADLLWSFDPRNMTECIAGTREPGKHISYLQRAIDTHSDQDIKPHLIYSLLYYARSAGADSLVSTYYRKLATEFPASPSLALAKPVFDPSRSLQAGKSLPDFSAVSLDDPTVVFTKKGLLGTIYLIDFWAIWCQPCVNQIKYVSPAYERFKSKGFKVLSASFDQTPEQVAKFRKERWPMPWFHTHVKLGGQDPFAKLFEIKQIPKHVLVGADGRILAVDDGLFGEELELTLSKIFAQ